MVHFCVQTISRVLQFLSTSDEVLVSYDVASLYTNVPVNEALHRAADLLYSGRFTDIEPPIDKETFLVLANLCLTDVLVLGMDEGYGQCWGLPGGPRPGVLLRQVRQEEDDVLRDARLRGQHSGLRLRAQLHLLPGSPRVLGLRNPGDLREHVHPGGGDHQRPPQVPGGQPGPHPLGPGPDGDGAAGLLHPRLETSPHRRLRPE